MLSRVGPPPLLPLNSINTAQGYTPIVQPYSLKGRCLLYVVYACCAMDLLGYCRR